MRLFKILILLTAILFIAAPLIYEAHSAEENPCVACHADLKKPAKSVHAAIALGCSSCHKTVEGKNHPAQKGSIILTQNMPGLCFGCHDEAKFKDKSVHQPVSGGMCTGCHDAHQSNFPKLLMKNVPGLCYNCHKEANFTGKGKSGHTNIGMCNGCHAPHSSKSNKLLLNEQPELCYTCHEKSKFSKKYVHSVIPVAGCTTCHIPHIGDNPGLLISPIFELCTSCHAAKADGRHIVTIPGKKKVHPLKGMKDPLFPGTKKIPDPFKAGKELEVPDPDNPGKEVSCITCHNPHSSDFAKLFPQQNICGRCHKFY
jgi:predicted CXXCH cytochrome family protein